jgi:hypothetical protein
MSKKINFKRIALVYILISFIILPFARFIPNQSKHEQGTPLIRPEEWANLEKPILFAPNLQPIPLDLASLNKEKILRRVKIIQ